MAERKKRNRRKKQSPEEALAGALGANPTPKKGRTGRPPKTSGPETQARILDAAERLFALSGYAGCRTADIAHEAGVTRAMIHYYFENKQRMYQAVLDRILFELIRLVQEVTSTAVDRPTRVREFLSRFFDYVARHPHFGRLSVLGGHDDRYFRNIVSNFFRPLFDQGTEFVQEGIDAGEFRNVNAQQFVFSIYSVTMGYFADSHFLTLLLRDDALAARTVAQRRGQVLDMVCTSLGIPSA